MPEGISFQKQLKPVLDIADMIIAGDEEAAMAAELPEDLAPLEDEAEAPVEEAPLEETPEGVDLSPLHEIVGEENAARIWEAAQQREDLAALTPQELADRLAEDFQLHMELEKISAGMEEAALPPEPAMEEMPMEGMPPEMMGGPGGPGMMPPGM
tara:strand:- start:3214 stop:3678 length:465 start_codon:yes stop_codon:yes gene_type:complete